jgi:hypothetical protein
MRKVLTVATAALRRINRGTISEQLLTISGANRDVLREAPKERTKQVAMGAVLLSTAAIAAVSASYALYLALHLWAPLALAGGVAWGLIILNLDRWLVVSTPRLRTKWGTLAMALPRVLLAVLIGAVISTPLTLAIFSAEIDTEIQNMAREAEEKFNDDLDADSRFAAVPAMKSEIGVLEQELREGPSEADVLNDPAVIDLQGRLDAVTAQYNEAVRVALCERDGTCGTGDPGFGAATEQKEAEAERLAGERDALTRQLEDLKEQVREQLQVVDERQDADATVRLGALRVDVAEAATLRADAVAAHQAEVADSDGILARLAALGRLDDGNSELAAAHLLLFLFMTALECLPIIFKTMLALGPPTLYERLVALEEEKVEARVRLRMQTEYEEAETLARSALTAAEARAARTLEAESKATGMVLNAQLAVTREGVRRWRDEQLSAAELDALYGEDLEALEADLTGKAPEHR